MIFPFWVHLSLIKKTPMTLMLLALNVLIFLLIPNKDGLDIPSDLVKPLSSKNFISVQAFLYENYIKETDPKEWNQWLQRFYKERKSNDGVKLEEFWYQQSFRDGPFLKAASQRPHYPDEIRYQSWKKIFLQLEANQKKDFFGLFGVSIYGEQWSHYLTYQFIHAGLLHLLSNMIILILFGVLIELQIGSLWTLMIYLIGGYLGALFYSATTGNNLAPLVGASGSVSALIMFLLMVEKRKNLRFFYFLAPLENLFGDIYLSKWWLVPIMILGDINSVITSADGNLNVAHMAHLGAIIFGLFAGLIYKFLDLPINMGASLPWLSEETLH